MKSNSRLMKAIAAVCVIPSMVGFAACGSSGDSKGETDSQGNVELNVWAWEATLTDATKKFEAKYPNIKVKLRNVGSGNKHYIALDNAIQAGSGAPDVTQMEYLALAQYAINKHLVDITDRTSGFDKFYTPGTWNAVQWGGKTYGLPMDSGPMAFFYNKDVFDKSGVDPTSIKTWDDYYQAAKKIRATGSYITSEEGDGGFFEAMSWAAGGKPYKTSQDGSEIKVNLTADSGVKTYVDFWQKMVSEDLVDTKTPNWSDEWFRSMTDDSIASLLIGAWMPTNMVNSAPAGAGKWRVATLPTPDGSKRSSEYGGSSLAILSSSKKVDAAYKYIEFINHDKEGIKSRVDGGAFPSDEATLESQKFLESTKIKNSKGEEVDYFGGQQINKVFAESAKNVSTDWQFLPFEEYARGKFKDYISKVYSDGSPFSKEMANYQKDLTTYADRQGFKVK